jgi:capsular exopolysaccharide synthesis family protein
MSGNLIPSNRGADSVAWQGGTPPARGAWPPGTDRGSIPWNRYLSALRRRRVVVVLAALAGIPLGLLLTRLVRPTYENQLTIRVANDAPVERTQGPIRGDRVLETPAWAKLLTSYAVLDRVVNDLSLFVSPDKARDTIAFREFHADGRLRADDYALHVDDTGRRYILANGKDTVVELGTVGDSIGRAMGFRWAPTAQALGRDRTIEFAVTDLREASRALRKRLLVELADTSFIVATLVGVNPHRDAEILNAIGRQFVSIASDVNRAHDAEVAKTLERQLADAENALKRSEASFARFRTGTITLPGQGASVMGGLEPGADPAVGSFYIQRIQSDSLRQDRTALEGVLAATGGGAPINVGALLAIPAARSAPELAPTLADLTRAEDSLAVLRRTYTAEYRPLQALQSAVTRMRTQTIPQLARMVLARLRAQEQEVGSRVATTSRQLQAIPSRSMQAARLQRDVQTNEGLFTLLKNRYESARLAEVMAIPDVSVLDSAVAPRKPTRNTIPLLLLTAVLLSVAAGVGLVLLLDRVDPRFRYPEQASGELGLPILGAIPRVVTDKKGRQAAESALQVVEAFRSLRLSLRHAQSAPGPLVLTITSPGAGDGKSLIATNLAISFAEAGYRTLLVDGDIRRGQLHAAFEVDTRPGLTEYLNGQARPEDILRLSSQSRLTIVPSGGRDQRAPELLDSDMVPRLFAHLKPRYDVILVDSPPLGAAIDACELGTATGSMLIVLRSGETDRRMAQARLAIVDRLPVRVLGAVLNDISADGQYRYYSYLNGYSVGPVWTTIPQRPLLTPAAASRDRPPQTDAGSPDAEDEATVAVLDDEEHSLEDDTYSAEMLLSRWPALTALGLQLRRSTAYRASAQQLAAVRAQLRPFALRLRSSLERLRETRATRG